MGADRVLPSPPMSKASVGSHVNRLGRYPELRSGAHRGQLLSVPWLLE